MGFNEDAQHRDDRKEALRVYSELVQAIRKNKHRVGKKAVTFKSIELDFAGYDGLFVMLKPQIGRRTGGFGYGSNDNPVIALVVRIGPEARKFIFNTELAVDAVNTSGKHRWEFLADVLETYDEHSDTFVHEFTHYLDEIRGVGSTGSAAKVATGDMAGYYNDPRELNAYCQEVAAKMQSNVAQIVKRLGPEKAQTLVPRYLGKDGQEFMGRFFDVLSHYIDLSVLTDESTQMIRNWAVDFYPEILDSVNLGHLAETVAPLPWCNNLMEAFDHKV